MSNSIVINHLIVIHILTGVHRHLTGALVSVHILVWRLIEVFITECHTRTLVVIIAIVTLELIAIILPIDLVE